MFRKIAVFILIHLALSMPLFILFLVLSADLYGPNLGTVFTWTALLVWTCFPGSTLLFGSLLLFLFNPETTGKRLVAMEQALGKIGRMSEPTGSWARTHTRNPSPLAGEGPSSGTGEPGQRESRETQEVLAEAAYTILEQAKRLAEYQNTITVLLAAVRVGADVPGEVRVPPLGGSQWGRDDLSDERMWCFFGEDSVA